jgi:hypothetical protein
MRSFSDPHTGSAAGTPSIVLKSESIASKIAISSPAHPVPGRYHEPDSFEEEKRFTKLHPSAGMAFLSTYPLIDMALRIRTIFPLLRVQC